MIELLTRCGFKEQELKLELPRIEKAFDRLGITAEDIARGKQRLNKYYDTELEGIRKIFRLCMLEVVNSILAREEGKTKIIWGFMMPAVEIIGSALMSKYKEVFVAYHSNTFFLIVGGIFDKMVPILEAAERKWLKAGAVAHCGNVKAIVGLLVSDILPKPDLIVTSGYLCETAPKTLDLLHEVYGLPICSCDTCLDREVGEYPEAAKRSLHLAASGMRNFTKMIQEVAGLEITDDMLWEVMNARKRLDDAATKLRGMIENSDPLPMSATHEIVWKYLTALALSLDRLPEAIDAIETLCEEMQERVDKGIGVVEKGAPRIMAILPPHQSDPRLEHLFGELGMAIVASDGRLAVPYGEVPQDPYDRMSMHLQTSLATIPAKRMPLIIEACKRLKLDGVLNHYHVGCRSVAADALIIEEAIKKELGIPVLSLEWENWDPRAYNHEEYKRRLEVFKTMMMKKSA